MKFLRALGFSLFLMGYSALAVEPDIAVQLLYGAGDSTHYDVHGYSYRIFTVSESKDLQSLFDTITARLLQTSVGEVLCREVLEANVALLKEHLALSSAAAVTAADRCAKTKTTSWMVNNSPDHKPEKMTLGGAASPRRYVLVVTDRPDLPLDSYTDAFSNQTTLFLHNSNKSSDLSLSRLTQVLAHEMAIYFDAKSWPKGPGWNSVPLLAESRIDAKNLRYATSATLNPTLSTILSYIRAYKVEKQVLREIASMGLLGSDPIVYDTKELPFLSEPCRVDCLLRFIRDQSAWINLFQPALLALSPHYRAQRVDMLREESLTVSESLLNAFERYPTYYFSQLKNDVLALNLVARPQSDTEKQMHNLINSAMVPVLKADLEALRGATIWVPSEKKTYDLLTFLSVPLLSDTNISISAGPRPRIRTGGTR